MPKFKIGDKVRVFARINAYSKDDLELVVEEVTMNKQPEFSPDWPHGCQTRSGNVARVLATDLPGDRPVAVYVEAYDEKPHEKPIYRCRSNGRVHDGDDWGSSCDADIINSPAPKRKWWVNIWDREFDKGITGPWSGTLCESREEADRHEESNVRLGIKRLACVCVTEGDGL